MIPNLMVGSFLGIVSGKYIFEDSLKEYWTEQRELQQQQQQQGGGATNPTSTNQQ